MPDKTSAIYAEAFRLESEVKQLREALAAARRECGGLRSLIIEATLKPPAAAPAAETKPALDALGRATPAPPQGPGMLDVLRAYGAPPSEPAAPAPTLDQLRADLERAVPGADYLAASLRDQFHAAPAQGAEARDAFLREAEALIRAASWPCNETLIARVNAWLAARAAPHAKGEGTT